jgi:hypothetical protein
VACGRGRRVYARGLFPGGAAPPDRSDRARRLEHPVTTRRPGNVDPVPIAYASRLVWHPGTMNLSRNDPLRGQVVPSEIPGLTPAQRLSRGLSQLATSFIASWHQGPLSTVRRPDSRVGVRTQAQQGWCFIGRLRRYRGTLFTASQLRYACSRIYALSLVPTNPMLPEPRYLQPDKTAAGLVMSSFRKPFGKPQNPITALVFSWNHSLIRLLGRLLLLTSFFDSQISVSTFPNFAAFA